MAKQQKAHINSFYREIEVLREQQKLASMSGYTESNKPLKGDFSPVFGVNQKER